MHIPADEVEGLRADNQALRAEVARLRLQVANQQGDDHCRFTDSDIADMVTGVVPIQPWEQFGESCRRFHAQIAAENGLTTAGCMTIAQLEAEIEYLRAALRPFAKFWHSIPAVEREVAKWQSAKVEMTTFAAVFEEAYTVLGETWED